jgi:hypothetical protein
LESIQEIRVQTPLCEFDYRIRGVKNTRLSGFFLDVYLSIFTLVVGYYDVPQRFAPDLNPVG